MRWPTFLRRKQKTTAPDTAGWNETDFLQAIKTDPDDETPRLIYADWLDARKNPRGEFIRVQCELSQLEDDYETATSHYAALKAREAELLGKHGEEWAGHLRAAFEGFKKFNVKPIFRRGMLEGLSVSSPVKEFSFLSANDFLKRVGKLTLPGPHHEVAFHEIAFKLPHQRPAVLDNSDLSKFAKSKVMEPITRLDLRGQYYISAAGIRALTAKKSTLRDLEELHISGSFFSARRGAGNQQLENSAASIRALTQFPSLKTLDLSLCTLPNSIVEILAAEGSELHHLEELRLDARRCDGQAMAALAAETSPFRHSLKKLTVLGRPVSGYEHNPCAALPDFPNLESFYLNGIEMRQQDVNALAQCRNLRNLELIDTPAPNINIGMGDLYAHLSLHPLFVPESQLARLENLRIRSNWFGAPTPYSEMHGISAKTLNALASPDCPLENLRHVTFDRCYLDSQPQEEALCKFMDSPVMQRLHTLRLTSNSHSNAVVKALAESKTPKALVDLDMGLNADASSKDIWEPLVTSSAMAHLKTLTLPVSPTTRNNVVPFIERIATRRRVGATELKSLQQVNFTQRLIGAFSIDERRSIPTEPHQELPIDDIIRRQKEEEERRREQAPEPTQPAKQAEQSPTVTMQNVWQIKSQEQRNRRGE